MKKTLILAALLIAATALAGRISKGFGQKVTATTTPVELNVGERTSDSAEFVHVTVTSGEVRLMMNTDTNTFYTGITTGLCVTAGFPQTFWTGASIKSICYATETNTAVVIFNFQ